MWDYLETIYKQDNSAHRFHLELEFSEYCQWNKSIQEFHSGFISLWTEFVELVYATVPESEANEISFSWNSEMNLNQFAQT